MKRKPKIVLPAKYILLILTVVCVAAMITSFTLNISGGPLNAVAGYVFVPMQRGINTVGAWITEKADNLKNLSDVMSENDALKKQVDELTSELNTNNLEQYELENLRELLALDQKYPSYETKPHRRCPSRKKLPCCQCHRQEQRELVFLFHDRQGNRRRN